MAAIDQIEGIGDVFAQQLRQAGVETTDALLERGASKTGRQELAQATGIDESRILRFVNHADLMRVKGIGKQYSELLEAAGVDSVPELARRNPENLHKQIEEKNNDRNLVREVAALSQVSEWVKQAASLDRVVTH